jgi:hypothetical protein
VEVVVKEADDGSVAFVIGVEDVREVVGVFADEVVLAVAAGVWLFDEVPVEEVFEGFAGLGEGGAGERGGGVLVEVVAGV